MNSIFIDANIFLEVQLDQDRAEECKKLLKFLEDSEDVLWTNSFLLFSMLLTIQHKTGDLGKCKELVTIINSYKGIRIYNPGPSAVINALNLQEEYELDFDDALVLSSMDQLNISGIVTFDRDFEEIDRIDILSPQEALTQLIDKNKNVNEE